MATPTVKTASPEFDPPEVSNSPGVRGASPEVNPPAVSVAASVRSSVVEANPPRVNVTPGIRAFSAEFFTVEESPRVFSAVVEANPPRPNVSPAVREFATEFELLDATPAVSLDTPAVGPVCGTFNMDATASAGDGIAYVEFLVDGVVVGTDASFPYSISYDSTVLSDGPHVFQARAWSNLAFFADTPELSLVVDNTAPVTALTSPAFGALAGSINLAATASDTTSGVAQVEFLVDGFVVNTDVSSPYVFVYDTTVLSDGPHNFQARAKDGCDNETTTPVLNLVVDNSPPLVSYDGPLVGPLSGVVAFTATASDPHSGIGHVELWVDGAQEASDFGAPYSISLNTLLLSNGNHDFAFRAYNAAGLFTDTPDTTLAVLNVAPAVDPSAFIHSDEFEFETESSNTASVTDGLIRFHSNPVINATPFIKTLRDRAAASTTSERVVNRLWAETTVVDQDQLYQNFGFPIQVQQPNSVEFKNVLQGLWYAYWNGPTIDNMERGLNLVFNLPYAPEAGVVGDASLADQAVLTGSVASSLNIPAFTFDTSSTNPGGDSRFLAFSVNKLPPTLVIFPNSAVTPAASVVLAINTAAGSPIASLSLDGRVVLTASTSVEIDAVIGNPGLGFTPSDEDFGEYSVEILFDSGETDTLTFGSEFALAVSVGQRVDRFQPLTKAVRIFDYVKLPGWWKVLGIPKINPAIETFSPEDVEIVNDILKDFTFAVRIVSDAFTRLGSVDRSVVRYFLEQIKPTITDYLFVIATTFFEVMSLTDDRDLLGLPATSAEYKAQHAGQNPAIALNVGLKNRRNIDWNFANFYITSPAARAAFESSYHLPAYDDAHLETEDVTLVAPGSVELIDGDGLGNSYLQASIVGSVDSMVFDTVAAGSLTVLVNGIAVAVSFTPLVGMPLAQVLDEINAVSSVTVGVMVNIARKPSGLSSVGLYADSVPGTPTLQITVGNVSLGFVAGPAVSGTASLGSLSVTSFS